jgi:transposase
MPATTPSRRRRARLKVVHPRSAGIYIGSRFHVVAVPPELDDEPVRKFSSFTNDLKSLATWLLAIGICTVAMESTGIYWVPLYEILVDSGLEVFLVNARHAKNVPGRSRCAAGSGPVLAVNHVGGCRQLSWWRHRPN